MIKHINYLKRNPDFVWCVNIQILGRNSMTNWLNFTANFLSKMLNIMGLNGLPHWQFGHSLDYGDLGRSTALFTFLRLDPFPPFLPSLCPTLSLSYLLLQTNKLYLRELHRLPLHLRIFTCFRNFWAWKRSGSCLTLHEWRTCQPVQSQLPLDLLHCSLKTPGQCFYSSYLRLHFLVKSTITSFFMPWDDKRKYIKDLFI